MELDPGHRGPSRSPRARRSRSRRPSRTSTRTRSSPRSTPTPATTCSCCSRAAARASAGAARSSPRACGASSRSAATSPDQRRARRAPGEHRPLDHQLRQLAEALGAQRHAPRRVGHRAERGARRLRRPGGGDPGEPARAAARPCGRRGRALDERATSSRACSGPAAREADPGGAGVRAGPARRCSRSCARPWARSRPDPPVHAIRSDADQAPQAGRRTRSPRRRSRPALVASATSTASSTPGPTTRRARRRATCSGPPG